MGIESTRWGKVYHGLPAVYLTKPQAEHVFKLVCHEIHRIRYRLSSAWLPAAEKDALEAELWLLTDLEKEIDDQL